MTFTVTREHGLGVTGGEGSKADCQICGKNYLYFLNASLVEEGALLDTGPVQAYVETRWDRQLWHPPPPLSTQGCCAVHADDGEYSWFDLKYSFYMPLCPKMVDNADLRRAERILWHLGQVEKTEALPNTVQETMVRTWSNPSSTQVYTYIED